MRHRLARSTESRTSDVITDAFLGLLKGIASTLLGALPDVDVPDILDPAAIADGVAWLRAAVEPAAYWVPLPLVFTAASSLIGLNLALQTFRLILWLRFVIFP